MVQSGQYRRPRPSSESTDTVDLAKMDSPRSSFAGPLASARFASRRIVLALACRFANHRFAFSVAAIAVLAAKCIHIYAHLTALPPSDLLLYGLSCFTQDVILLLILRLLLDAQLFSNHPRLRVLIVSLTSVFVVLLLFLAAISISFFTVAGSELHWRNVNVAGDSSSWTMLLTGLFSCSLVFCLVFLIAWLSQDFCYIIAGIALNLVKWPFTFLASKFCRHPSTPPRTVVYQHVPQHDLEGALEIKPADDNSVSLINDLSNDSTPSSRWSRPLHVLVVVPLVIQLITTLCRPEDSPLNFISWTLPLLPFIDFAHASPNLSALLLKNPSASSRDWGNVTALAEPIQYPWLPKDAALPGFEDWYANKDHYKASKDPLKISNLQDQLLAPLRGKLQDVKIRHVMLIKLESTRKDVFPIKKDGLIWEKLTGSFKNTSFPDDAAQRLATLTQTANLLTGDYDDGFPHANKTRRGGINANTAITTSTYTLKSLVGTYCGLSPLVADFNADQDHHYYQPCLPHIFDALNRVADVPAATAPETSPGRNFTAFPWRSMFMQSVTETYDKQDAEMLHLGFRKENLVTKEFLQSGAAKFGKSTLEEINYYGMPEVAVKEYIRDAFATAKQNDERLFLGHLTSTTHHPFSIPKEETYVPLSNEKKLDDLSHYLNAVGFVDRWIGQVLQLLEEEGVADETLVVLVGDHGLSVPENGGITPYYNYNIGNFHVPLVLSHPRLPPIDINDAVVSLEILPTILDLLVETNSLTAARKQAAQDLMENYEGQSLIRPLRKFSEETGEGDWQFTVLNPGRASVSVRDARQPHWRIVVPVVADTEWRFSNLDEDPHEKKPILSFSFSTFLRIVARRHGDIAAKWAEEAAFLTRWWVEENNKRWRYDPNE